MVRTVIIYAASLACGAALLDWLDYGYAVRAYPGPVYVALIAVASIALGIWAGARLTPRRISSEFERNEAAIRSLRLTGRECEILELMAAGQSNKQIARTLSVSPNTVKTHVAHVLEKLDAARRTEAISKARALQLIR